MATQEIAKAIERMRGVFSRRPQLGMSEDTVALARWEGGTRVVTRRADGTSLATDMPRAIGGTGDQLSAGWLFRAALVACSATSIALTAAAEGVALSRLELDAVTRSDSRGLLGMADEAGRPIDAGYTDLRLAVRIAAAGTPPDRLRAVVDTGLRRSPVYATLADVLAIDVSVDVNGS